MFNCKLPAVLLSSMVLLGCAQLEQKNQSPEMQAAAVSSEQALVSAEIWYRERMLLPDNAQLTLVLADVALADAPSQTIASKTLTLTNTPPWNVDLNYDPSVLTEQGTYVLQARIEVNGQLLFINTTSTPAFAEQDNKAVNMMLSKVSMDRKAAMVNTDAGFENTYWKLIELNGSPVVTKENAKDINMTFSSEEQMAQGFSGCNGFSGGYQLNGNQITFSPFMSTMMACPDMDKTEIPFLKTLADTELYEINGKILSLVDAQSQVIMRFKAASED
ncbi:META domain-containing protein [Psychromonas ossibalaenae]|uniref:META domain-containing protein n=1 Tax=Psychromonas ossibalaenae TaxID=444922 RepID=UPI00037E7E56|nr:META domain-containing protein [Psychromonas ossibalaenae]